MTNDMGEWYRKNVGFLQITNDLVFLKEKQFQHVKVMFTTLLRIYISKLFFPFSSC